MFIKIEVQETLSVSLVDVYLLTWVEAFLMDCHARNLAQGTIHYYRKNLAQFCDFCDAQLVKTICEITPHLIRQYLLYLEEKGNNPGGRHAKFRSLRTFLNWYEIETKPDNWKNPIREVKPLIVPQEPLEPIPDEDIEKMLKECDRGKFIGDRDAAIIYILLDTGIIIAKRYGLHIQDTAFSGLNTAGLRELSNGGHRMQKLKFPKSTISDVHSLSQCSEMG